ncbi:MAG: hypothetical protein IJD02_05805 [Lachnospiraceae bacterium]|nr:hypothetical protein [Lachnospiraceae bacterium]
MSNIIKYNYIRYEGNETKNVTCNYDSFFRTVGQAVERVNVSSDSGIETEETLDLGELLTAPREDMSEAGRIEQALKEQEEFLNSRVDAVIAQANLKANRIVEQANDNARYIYEDSKKKGYEEGYELAKTEAYKEVEELKAQYENMMRENDEILDRQAKMIENKVVDTVCKVLDNITGICFSQYETAIVSLIAKTLAKGENSNNYYIKVSNKDFPVVMEHKKELMECVREDALMDILPDGDMYPGQCLIETDGNVIDAGIDEQLVNLKTNLRLLAQI